jgi:hypothetical protein
MISRIAFRTIGLIAVLMFFNACSHAYQIKGFDADPANLKSSKNKKVAVVFLEPEFRHQYISSSQGHKFIFENTKAFYEQAYTSALRDSVSSVEFFTKAPGPGFDIYLYPELKLEVKSKGLGSVCEAEYELVSKDKNGREIARLSKSSDHSFMLIANANEACTIAMLNTFDEVTYGIFQSMDGL